MGPNSMLNYKDIFNVMTLPFLVAGSDRKILFTNDNCIEFLNLDRSKIHTLTLEKIFKIESSEIIKMEESIQRKQNYSFSTQFEYSPTEISEIQLTIKGLRVAMDTKLGYYIEIDLKKDLNFSKQDLVNLGNQTSHIAHEISNPLSVIKIQCDNFSLKAQKQTSFSSEDVLERMKTLSKATDRIQHSNSDLKSLSKDLISLELDSLKRKIATEDIDFPQH